MEHVGVDVVGDKLVNLGGGGPDVFEIDVIAVLVLAEWMGGQVDIHCAR